MQDQVRILAGSVPLYAHVECALINNEEHCGSATEPVLKGSNGCPHCQEFEQVDLGSPPEQMCVGNHSNTMRCAHGAKQRI